MQQDSDRHFLTLKAFPPPPIPRLPLQERANRTKIALVSQEVGLLSAFGPETNGIRQRVHRLRVAADERSTKVYARQAVLLGM
jgi:hypothetical protein